MHDSLLNTPIDCTFYKLVNIVISFLYHTSKSNNNNDKDNNDEYSIWNYALLPEYIWYSCLLDIKDKKLTYRNICQILEN